VLPCKRGNKAPVIQRAIDEGVEGDAGNFGAQLSAVRELRVWGKPTDLSGGCYEQPSNASGEHPWCDRAKREPHRWEPIRQAANYECHSGNELSCDKAKLTIVIEVISNPESRDQSDNAEMYG
jgi:hypothetical protein